MMQSVHFTKMSGAGNDFILIDNRYHRYQFNSSTVAELCHRHQGIGADGLMLLESSEFFDFKMVYFNSDGKLGSLCGNGARCITKFASLCGLSKSAFRFEANNETYFSELTPDGEVRLHMRAPSDWKFDLSDGLESFSFVNTGSPHVILFRDSLDTEPVVSIGSRIRHNTTLFPEGTNVNFVSLIDKESLRIRTFERGVENETLACGTGAVASALMARKLGFVTSNQIRLKVQSGEWLEVTFDNDLSTPTLKGSAKIVFSGEIPMVIEHNNPQLVNS
ncbi:MAG: diaminopimelate epimerase [Chloroherpetonaceae bacterium]|nr:diaminopimelate epimerase [Chloroherpetonaceae bacterium]